MMHYIYDFASGYPIGQYSSLQGYIIDRWAVQYALDVKERTTYLANKVMQLSTGQDTHSDLDGEAFSFVCFSHTAKVGLGLRAAEYRESVISEERCWQGGRQDLQHCLWPLRRD